MKRNRFRRVESYLLEICCRVWWRWV